MLKNETSDKPVLYYYGKRWASVHHARLRMQCSKLNFDLFYKLFVRDSPACRCGATRETASHFFLHCPIYNDIRPTLYAGVTKHTAFNIKTLLYGDSNLSQHENKDIFDAVHEFLLVRFV